MRLLMIGVFALGLARPAAAQLAKFDVASVK
jgi:hypothetical protein